MRLSIESLRKQLALIGVKETVSANAVRELIEYRVAEEDLGICLITLYKALRDGVYTKDYGYVPPALLSIHGFRIAIHNHDVLLPFKGPVGYGESWALTKEELE